VQVSDGDAITPPKPALAAAAQAPWSQVEHYPGGHFDIYVGEGFERAVADQVAFLERVLPGSEDRVREVEGGLASA
jgi:fermentation-respiration switch protein FrsA (DUF1100 family)